MKRRISLSTTVTLVLLTAALTVSLTMLLAMRHFNNQLQLVSQRQAMYTHINDVDKTVRDYYPNIDEELLRQGITQGYIYGLDDPYAAYYTPTRYAAEQLRMAGKANNVGITLVLNNENQVVVGRVQPDSAAGKAGVKSGDHIKAVDGETVVNTSLSELQNLANTATKLLLSVERKGSTHAFELSAFEYTVRSVEYEMVGSVGYIRISAFYKNTPAQFRTAVSKLLEKGATGLVFDLRNNAGGSTTAVREMLDYVMPLGTYGTMTDVKGEVTKLSSADSNQISCATATLVNGGTAGEAEFFAAVLKEAGVSNVVGQITAGKAKYQEYFAIESDSSAVRLTVGEYGLLKTESWQDKGIEPTVAVEMPAEQAGVYQLLSPKDDVQVRAAISLVTTSDVEILKKVTSTTAVTVTTTTTAKTTTTTKKK